MGAIGAEDQDQMLHDRSHDQIIPGIPAENTLGTHQGGIPVSLHPAQQRKTCTINIYFVKFWIEFPGSVY